MRIADVLGKVEKSKDFRKLKKENPEFYLAHAFTMIDENEKKGAWELGFYSPERDRLAVFETEPKVRLKSEDEVFKQEGIVKPLDVKKIKVSFQKAMELCDELLKSKYSAQTVTKRIVIIQSLERPMYNVTLVTRSFSILNIKIDCQTGEVISDNLQSLMKLGTWEKGGRER